MLSRVTSNSWVQSDLLCQPLEQPGSQVCITDLAEVRFFFLLLCVHVLVDVCLCSMLVPGAHGGQRGHQITRIWSYSQLGAAMWGLGSESGSPGRASHALHLWGIFPDPKGRLVNGFAFTSASRVVEPWCLFLVNLFRVNMTEILFQ